MLSEQELLEMERPVSARHAPMRRCDRAAQFAPFAALSGSARLCRRPDGWRGSGSSPLSALTSCRTTRFLILIPILWTGCLDKLTLQM